MDFLEDLEDLGRECLRVFLEEVAGNATRAKSPVGATIVILDWEFRVSVAVSRTGTEGEGPASKSEPFLEMEPWRWSVGLRANSKNLCGVGTKRVAPTALPGAPLHCPVVNHPHKRALELAVWKERPFHGRVLPVNSADVGAVMDDGRDKASLTQR